MPTANWTGSVNDGDVHNLSNYSGNPGSATGTNFNSATEVHPPNKCTDDFEVGGDLNIVNGAGRDYSFFSNVSVNGGLNYANVARLDLAYAATDVTGDAGELHIGEYGGGVITSGTTTLFIGSIDDGVECDIASQGTMYGNDSLTGVQGGPDTLLLFQTDRSALIDYESPPGVLTADHAAVNLLGSRLGNEQSLITNGSASFSNFSIDAENPYVTITGGVGQTVARGATISGTYSQALSAAPSGVTVGGVAATSFTASLGNWSCVVAAGTPTGAQPARLLYAAKTQDWGVDDAINVIAGSGGASNNSGFTNTFAMVM